MKQLDRIAAILEPRIDQALLARLLSHYWEIKYALFVSDWEECLARGGKFAEEMVRLVHHVIKGETLQKIQVSQYIDERAKGYNQEVRFLLQHIKLLYGHRSNRGGGHTSFDPQEMDAWMVTALADWAIAEVIRIFGAVSPTEAWEAVKTTTVRSYPLIEDFDGDKVVLNPNLSLREKICLLLYAEYPKPVEQERLRRWISSRRRDAGKTLSRMVTQSELYRKDGKIYLTAKGRAAAEDILRRRCGSP